MKCTYSVSRLFVVEFFKRISTEKRRYKVVLCYNENNKIKSSRIKVDNNKIVGSYRHKQKVLIISDELAIQTLEKIINEKINSKNK